MKDHIVEHVRDKNGRPYATLAAYKNGRGVFISCAKCSGKLEPFKKNVGSKIALERAKKLSNIGKLDNESLRVDNFRLFEDCPFHRKYEWKKGLKKFYPVSINDLRKFYERCKRYFKDNNFYVKEGYIAQGYGKLDIKCAKLKEEEEC